MHRNRVPFAVMLLALTLVLPLVGTVALTGAGSPAGAQQVAGGDGQASKAGSKAQKRSSFPGYRQGKIYLGMSCGVECARRESHLRANVGLKRWFRQWGNWNSVASAIQEDNRKDRRTWISIEGPSGGSPAGWQAVAQGRYDHQIRELAQVLKHHDRQPIFLSFDHEMSNKATEAQASWWANGFNRFHDVLKKSHALRKVALAPIHASWLFSKFNDHNPAKWLPPSVLKRSSFVAVDVYQNWKGESFGNRINRVDRWLNRHGRPHMKIGVGEMGATNGLGGQSASAYLNQSLRWAANNRNKLVALSYFNSTANSASDVYWPLDESAQKADVYRSWLKRGVFVHRVR